MTKNYCPWVHLLSEIIVLIGNHYQTWPTPVFALTYLMGGNVNAISLRKNNSMSSNMCAPILKYTPMISNQEN